MINGADADRPSDNKGAQILSLGCLCLVVV
jgi:hypothetical protein